MEKPEYIIIHHSASADKGTLDYDGIYRYHVIERGWRDIAYHFVIEKLPGERYTVIMGRMPTDDGAHAPGYNHNSLGICFVGNFERTYVPPVQWALGVKLVRWLLTSYNLSTHRVLGHRDTKATACPGKNFNLQQFKDAIGYF